MPLILYSLEDNAFLSTLTLTTMTFPEYFFAMSSMVGSSMRQGPHHGAQKSTSTGFLLSRISLESSLSFTWTGLIEELVSAVRVKEVSELVLDNEAVFTVSSVFVEDLPQALESHVWNPSFGRTQSCRAK